MPALPDTSSARNDSDRRLWLLYHYLYPDPVVSAVHMHQLARGLAEYGWDVTGIAGNRGCRDESLTYPPHDEAEGITLRRIWRPRLRQSSTVGRLLNAAWMITAWSLLALDQDSPDAIVLGTDPVLSVLAAIFWKFIHPQTLILHWCFDLYPEATFAEGLLSPTSRAARVLMFLMKRAYRACDALVDIGPCMRERLAPYLQGRPQNTRPSQQATIVPWALHEPAGVLPSPPTERRIVGAGHKLVLLYSGSFGRAHTSSLLLALATALQGADAALAFSVQGNCEPELRAAIAALRPGSACAILQVPFAVSGAVLERLAAPDIHMLSLAGHWTGLVVPSKFFGALAIGRPLLFSGSRDSSIARWIEQYQLGWVIDAGNVDATAADLLAYIDNPQRISEMQQRCFDTYHQHFSRNAGVGQMAALLDALSTSP